MMRRPPGHVAHQRKLLLALSFLLPLSLVDAQQQQQQQQGRQQVSRQIQEQARQPLAAAILDNSDASNAFLDEASYPNRKQDGVKPKSPAQGDTPFVPSISVETPNIQRKRTVSSSENRYSKYDNIPIPDDASALRTVAPDLSVRAPPPPPHRVPGHPGHGLSSQHIARSLEEWEVEDFVLLATVDGDLYATDRKTGKVRWHTEIEKPVVETKHHRFNASLFDENYSPIDHYIWAIEPNRNGGIYIMVPGETGLVKTDLTMKRLVEEMSPYSDRERPVVYTGKKESTMVTLDAATGRVREWYGASDSDDDFAQFQPESCLRPSDFDSEECSHSGTITLGRTDYVVVVRRPNGNLIATLKYSEWGPNNYDKDLHQQYSATMDNRYITGKPNGQVYGFSFDRSADGGNSLIFSEALSAPIARVFDIARPIDAPPGTNPELLVLPQPMPPAEDEETARVRSTSTFVGETNGGSWFALSGAAYPLILDSPAAQCTIEGWWETHKDLNQSQLRKALTGRHSLANPPERTWKHDYPSLPEGPISHVSEDPENSSSVPTLPVPPQDPPTVITKVKELPQAAGNTVIDLLSNPLFLALVVGGFFWYRKELWRWIAKGKKHKWVLDPVEVEPSEPNPERTVASEKEKETATPADDEPQPQPNTEQPPTLIDKEATPEPTGESDKENSPTVRFADPVGEEAPVEPEVAPLKKKKAHRGRRGGQRHQKIKNNKREGSASRDDAPGPVTVEEAVNNAKQLGDQPRRLEPDLNTVSNDVEDVSGPILRMGSLEVNEDQELGTGSNGTVVFEGRWDGRAVAVKRMLIQFYDIASQETRLLRESDDHPNVIRYYAQQQRAAFLYIALELCHASLAQVVEKGRDPAFRDLAQAGERDLPAVLYQITNGVSHLHSLRIVHRDLKPQNILVNMGKDGKPRLLVSDFGLCKKLEGGQSSFGATTAHAAGTSGWRAPELLLDDDVRDNGTALVDASSTHSGSGSLVSSDLLPNRRATRAIDIFSLGLVFFYVLTKGSHPFDCGGRYMREVNIRKGNYNLDALDILGDFAYEAKNLISKMLKANPRERPMALEVMAHPFFWSPKKRLGFLCDVSDHFEKEPRDPPSEALQTLEEEARRVCGSDFLKQLPKDFIESLGKQRKYTGTRLLDLLRALRNKRNHYEDMSDSLKKTVGSLPDGYLGFWTRRFPNLLITCWKIVKEVEWEETDRFKEYYEPAGL